MESIGAFLDAQPLIGAIAPQTAPPGLLGMVGLVLFLHGIGIQYGRDFFKGLANLLGFKANLLAAVAVSADFLVTHGMGFELDFAAGMFAGSMTSRVEASKID